MGRNARSPRAARPPARWQEAVLFGVSRLSRVSGFAAPGREPLRLRRWLPVLLVPAAAGVGAAVAVEPLVAPAAIAAVVALWLLALGRRVVAVFHACLGVILVGYSFLGRGFAYVGVGPVYVGEAVLAVSLVAMLMTLPRARFGRLHALLLAYMAWGLVRTVPYIGTYSVDALRDGVMWAYGFFALAVSLTVEAEHFPRLAAAYRRLVPVFLMWMPVAAALTIAFGDRLPHLPGSTVPIVDVKAGDMGVQMAGVGAFLLLGLYGRASMLAELWTSAAWLVGAGLVASLNRGAMAAIAAAGTTILFVRRSSRWFRVALVGLLLLGAIALVNPEIDTPGSRSISFDQVVANVTSIFGDQRDTTNQATKEWRLQWWGTIADYTFGGRYFWTGKGFGVNLANDDGFQVLADQSLRAPHSINFDLLARTGVPGLFLWLALNIAFGLAVLRAAFRAGRAGRTFWVQVLGWVFVYWLAAFINGSFDVYLEGPQGGIWFWAVIGLGLAAIRASAAGGSDVLPAPGALPAPGVAHVAPARRPLPQR